VVLGRCVLVCKSSAHACVRAIVEARTSLPLRSCSTCCDASTRPCRHHLATNEIMSPRLLCTTGHPCAVADYALRNALVGFWGYIQVIERTEAFLAAPGGGATGAGEDVGLLAPLSPTVARV
jgi:hypothetical protein